MSLVLKEANKLVNYSNASTGKGMPMEGESFHSSSFYLKSLRSGIQGRHGRLSFRVKDILEEFLMPHSDGETAEHRGFERRLHSQGRIEYFF